MIRGKFCINGGLPKEKSLVTGSKNIAGLALAALRSVLWPRIFKQSRPLMATWFVTYRCNLSCEFCSVHNRTATELAAGEIISMLERFHKIGLRRVGFSGGEALLREDIGELVTGAKKIGVFSSVFTNGRLLAEKADSISDTNLVMVSVDGSEQVHDRSRGQGATKRTVEGIAAARANKTPVILSCVWTKDNVDQISAVLDFTDKVDAVGVFFHPMHTYFSDAQTRTEKGLSTSELLLAVNALRAAKKNRRRVLNTEGHLRYMEQHYPSHRRKCAAGKLHFAVTPDGKLMTCPHDFSGALPEANVPDPLAALQTLTPPPCDDCFCYPIYLQDKIYDLSISEVFAARSLMSKVGRP
jgi:MoaA/NifB/PqqE/SkfB family radical SAM enzyme